MISLNDHFLDFIYLSFKIIKLLFKLLQWYTTFKLFCTVAHAVTYTIVWSGALQLILAIEY